MSAFARERFLLSDPAEIVFRPASAPPEKFEDLGDPERRAALVDEILDALDERAAEGVEKHAEMKRDKLGRRYCLEKGKRVKCDPEHAAKEVHEAHQHIQGLHAAPRAITPEARHALASRLAGMTLAQLGALKKKLAEGGIAVKSSGSKSTQVEQIHRRATKQPAAPAPPARPPAKAAVAPPAPKADDHLARIASAFHADKGARHNLVSLADLKDATGLSVPELHAVVQKARKEGILSASALEGREGISPRERESAIREDGAQLGFVSEREPGALKKLAGPQETYLSVSRPPEAAAPAKPGGVPLPPYIADARFPGKKRGQPGPYDVKVGAPNAALPGGAEYIRHATAGQASALRRYAQRVYRFVNDDLRRRGKTDLPEHAEMQALFAAAPPMGAPATVYRGIRTTPERAAEIVAGLRPGSEQVFRGYMSTSTRPDVAGQFTKTTGPDDTRPHDTGGILFEIKAVHGLDTKPISPFPHEDELLLNHNSRFRVSGTTRAPDGTYHVELEQIWPVKKGATSGTTGATSPPTARPTGSTPTVTSSPSPTSRPAAKGGPVPGKAAPAPPSPRFTGTDANGHEWRDGVQVAKPAKAPESPPSKLSVPAVDFPAVERDLFALNAPNEYGITPYVPDLYDRLKERHPDLTEPAFHDLLRDMQSRDLLTMQAGGNVGGADHLAKVSGHKMERFPLHPRHGRVATIQTRPPKDAEAPPAPSVAKHAEAPPARADAELYAEYRALFERALDGGGQ